MKYFFLIVFFITSAIHLYASYIQNKKLRDITKPFLILSLLGWYCFAQSPINLMVVLALFFSWLGDVLLIPNGVKWFTAGGIAFMISHFFFILCYYPQVNFAVIPVWAIILIAAFYLTLVCFVFKGLRPYLPKGLFYPMFLYLMINGTMNSFALFQLISIPCTATIVTFIGAALFFCSDSILFYVRFSKDTRWKSHFPVMVTYLIGEFMIVLGLVLL